MIASDMSAAQLELYDIEEARSLALIRQLIRLAEATFEGWGGDDIDKWDQNQPLKQAFQQAGAQLTGLLLEQDMSCMPADGDKIICDLANAIAVRLGEEARAHWDRDTLMTLASHIK